MPAIRHRQHGYRRRRRTSSGPMTMYSAGMRTSSKKISPWFSARCPILSSGLPCDAPGRSSGTMNPPVPFTPSPISTAQNSAVAAAIVPFETHAAFCPLMTKKSPSLRATQSGLPYSGVPILSAKVMKSLPWLGSVPPQQPISSGEPKRSMSSGRPENSASMRGKVATPKLMASPASPQPNSSAMMYRSRRALYRREVVVGIGVGVKAERAVLLEHVPQNRLRRDHVRGVGQAIERDAGRPHHFGGKLVHQIAYPKFLLRQVDIEIHHRHWSLLSIREAPQRAAPGAAISRCGGA